MIGFVGAGEVFSVALSHLSASLVRVTATIDRGSDHGLRITGLRKEDVPSTSRNVIGALDPIRRRESCGTIDVDVSPAGAPNDGSLDLAIAMAFLLALEQASLPPTVALGELSVSGKLRHVRGVLPALRGAAAHGIQHAIVPRVDAPEAAHAGLEVRVVDHIRDVHDFVRGSRVLRRARPSRSKRYDELDFADKPWFPSSVRRAIEIAAAGEHPILITGGLGHASLALRLPAFLPAMTADEAFEVTSIHSVAGLLEAEQGLLASRPFRVPNYRGATLEKLLGGNDPARPWRVRPGEVSLAHGGVLFLDELLEFRSSQLAALGAALAKGESSGFPARPLLVGGSYACPCGLRGDPGRSCKCMPAVIERYERRLRSLFDLLFEMHVVLPPTFDTARPESSEVVRRRVAAARAARAARRPESEAGGERGLRLFAERRGVSSSDWPKVLRVARTIADLDGGDGVRERHVDEASKFVQESFFATAPRDDR